MKKNGGQSIEGLRKIVRKFRFVFFSIMMIIIGSLLILFSYFVPPTGILVSILKDLGLALFTPGCIGLWLEYQTREQYLEDVKNAFRDSFLNSDALNTKFERLYSNLDSLKDEIILVRSIAELGIKNVYRDRDQINVNRLIKSATPHSEIKIVGVTLRTLLGEETERILKDKLKEGCSFRILFLNADSDSVKELALEQKRNYESLKHDLETTRSTFCNILQELPDSDRLAFEIGEYDSSPLHFMVSVNNMMIICQYIIGKRGYDCPHFEIQKIENGVFELFYKQFEFIWSRRKSVSFQGI